MGPCENTTSFGLPPRNFSKAIRFLKRRGDPGKLGRFALISTNDMVHLKRMGPSTATRRVSYSARSTEIFTGEAPNPAPTANSVERLVWMVGMKGTSVIRDVRSEVDLAADLCLVPGAIRADDCGLADLPPLLPRPVPVLCKAGDQPSCSANHASIILISASCAVMTSSAKARTSGSEPCSRTMRAISMAP